MFEYALITWHADEDAPTLVAFLNQFGREGWEAVSLAPRSWDAPMAGMGADVVSEIVVLMKRPVSRAS